MKNLLFKISLASLIFIFSSRNNDNDKVPIKTKTSEYSNWKDHWENPSQKISLHTNSETHPIIKESLKDTSIIVLTATLTNGIERYSEVKSLGDLNNDGINDSILIIPELFITKENAIEEGA